MSAQHTGEATRRDILRHLLENPQGQPLAVQKSFQIHVILITGGLCPDMSPGCFSLVSLHALIIQLLLPNVVFEVLPSYSLTDIKLRWAAFFWGDLLAG